MDSERQREIEYNFHVKKKMRGLSTIYVIVEAEVMTVILNSLSLKRQAMGLKVYVRTARYTYTNTLNPIE